MKNRILIAALISASIPAFAQEIQLSPFTSNIEFQNRNFEITDVKLSLSCGAREGYIVPSHHSVDKRIPVNFRWVKLSSSMEQLQISTEQSANLSNPYTAPKHKNRYCHVDLSIAVKGKIAAQLVEFDAHLARANPSMLGANVNKKLSRALEEIRIGQLKSKRTGTFGDGTPSCRARLSATQNGKAIDFGSDYKEVSCEN